MSGPTRLRRLAVRFASPLFPGQEITTRFFAAGSIDGCSDFAFETTDDVGELVIRDGRAGVA